MLNPNAENTRAASRYWAPRRVGGSDTTRNGSLELLRVLGAFGIVLFHANGPASAIGYAALPLFILMSLQLQSGRGDLERRFWRFLTPFIAWSLIYTGLYTAQAVATQQSVTAWIAPSMILTGPSLHLWFLPFMAVCSTLFIMFHDPLSRLSPTRISTVFALIGLPCLYALNTDTLPGGVAQWVFGLPAVLLAPLLCRHMIQTAALHLVGWYTALLLLAVAGLSDGALQLGIALVVLFVANSVHIATPPWLSALSALSFGIYLIHPLIAAVLARLPTGLPGNSLMDVILIFVLSCVGAHLLRSTEVGRKIT